MEPHSISAGLDYPGIGPPHAYLWDTGRAKFMAITDAEAMQAGFELAKLEGIIPAIESSHALAALEYRGAGPDEKVIIGLSGRGDKDLATYMKWMK
ncbi:Tryptophan synthase beta chain [compost metagenome]